MRTGGVLLALNSELRRRVGAFVLAVVVVGLAGGAALTAVAGARRSDTAYARYRAWARAADFTAGSGEISGAELATLLARIERAPFMGAHARIRGTGASVRAPSGELFAPFQVQVLADRDDLLARGTFEREKVLHGRHADPASVNEATVSFSTAERLDVDVGDTIEIVSTDPPQSFPVTIVGVVARSFEFPTVAGTPKRSVAVTSAFLRAHAGLFGDGDDSLIFRLRDGSSPDEAMKWIRTNAEGAELFPSAVVVPTVERTIHIETIAWWLVAGVLALIFLVLVGQLLLRNAAAVADDVATMVVLGMTRRRIVGLGFARGAVIGAGGALVAIVVAIAASPLTPAGLARLAEPMPGVRVDPWVLLVGAIGIVAVSAVFGAGAAWRAHALTRAGAVHGRPLPLPSASVPVWAGLALLFRPFQRREQSLTRITVASLGFVVATIVGVAVTLAGLTRVQDDARLVGATWDGYVEVKQEANEQDVERGLAVVRKMPDVETATRAGFVVLPRPGREDQFGLQIFDDPVALGPAIAAGRAPVGTGEVAMGADEMRVFGVGIGDRFTLAPGEPARPQEVEVVGRSVLVPSLNYEAGPGEGIAMSTATALRFGVPKVDAAPLLLLRFKDGVNQTRALERARTAVGPDAFAVASSDQTVADGVRRVGTVPRGLMAFLTILGIVALVHLLLVSTRRRRTHIAVLRALGFTRSQVVSLSVAQSAAVAAAAALIGVPLGLLVGRIAWRWFGDYLNVVPVATTPIAAIAVIVLVIGGAALLAAVPAGVRATRLRAADALRVEG